MTLPAAASKSILIVAPRVPWPVRRSGFSVRFFPLLRHLGGRHHIDLIVLGETPEDRGSPLPPESQVTFCRFATYEADLWNRAKARLRGLRPGAAPYTLRSPWTDAAARAVLVAARRRSYDVLLWTGPEYLEAAARIMAQRPARRCVIDFVDSPSLVATRARDARDGRSEIAGIRRWENAIRSDADLALYISEADAAASHPVGMEHKTRVLPNGIFLDDLSGGLSPQPRPAGLPVRYILFFGHMSFGPNVDAAQRLAREIMPALRARYPDLGLVIAGHQPSAPVQALADAATIVTGSVDSMWPYIMHAVACVLPLRLAAGLQNKVLEALALGKAVVTTSHCAASAGAEPGVDLLVADSSTEFVEATLRLLGDAALASRCGEAGAKLVRSRFDWEILARRYESFILAADGGATTEP